MRSRAFLVVCLLSFGCTIIRETFNNWTPSYLHYYLELQRQRCREHERDLSGGRRAVGTAGRLAERPAGTQRPRAGAVSRTGRRGARALGADGGAAGSAGISPAAAADRRRRLVPARTLLLPRRRLRARLRRQAGERRLFGDHRRPGLSRRRTRRRQRGADRGRVRLARCVRGAGRGKRRRGTVRCVLFALNARAATARAAVAASPHG